MMFAVITPALITGAFAERMKFSVFVVFSLLWATFVYDPLSHWVWGGGWLRQARARSTSPAARSCTSARGSRRSSAALVIGKRGYGLSDAMPSRPTT